MQYATYAFPHWTIHLQGTGFGEVVEQEYKPIRIKWDGGYMDVVPPGIFAIEDTRTCLSKFRKVIKLSAMSDIQHKTNTISAWRKAIKADYDFMYRLSTIIADKYKALYEEIIDQSSKQDKHRASKLKQLQKRNSIELKRLDARKKRVQKCAVILEEIAEKYN